MSDRPKTGMRERARRKAEALKARMAKTQQTDAWLRERKAALGDRQVKAKRKAARVPKSQRGIGRVPANLRVKPVQPVVLVEPVLGTFRGVRANRATRRAMGQRGAARR